MSETYVGGTYATGDQEETKTGGVILMVTSCLAGLLVIAGLIYAMGTGGRHQAAVLAAGCEPTLFISGLPCTTQREVISKYEGIATPAVKSLIADTAAYRASEGNNLVAAEAALTAEVATEQALDNSLSAAAFTPRNRAAALSLITNSTSNGGSSVPMAAVTFTPQITVMVDALVRANQALATLTAEQARSSSLTQLRSLNHRVVVASTAVQSEMKLISKAVDAPLAAG
jgi:hypothetical protein